MTVFLPKINNTLITIYDKSGPEVVEDMKEIVPGIQVNMSTTINSIFNH